MFPPQVAVRTRFPTQSVRGQPGGYPQMMNRPRIRGPRPMAHNQSRVGGGGMGGMGGQRMNTVQGPAARATKYKSQIPPAGGTPQAPNAGSSGIAIPVSVKEFFCFHHYVLLGIIIISP